MEFGFVIPMIVIGTIVSLILLGYAIYRLFSKD